MWKRRCPHHPSYRPGDPRFGLDLASSGLSLAYSPVKKLAHNIRWVHILQVAQQCFRKISRAGHPSLPWVPGGLRAVIVIGSAAEVDRVNLG